MLLEQRPREGLWGGLWQVPTREMEQAPTRSPTAASLAKALRVPAGRGDGVVREGFVFKTTHRDVRFVVRGWRVTSAARVAGGRRWCTIDDALSLGMSSPMRRILTSLAT